jgi:hypothetical protein
MPRGAHARRLISSIGFRRPGGERDTRAFVGLHCVGKHNIKSTRPDQRRLCIRIYDAYVSELAESSPLDNKHVQAGDSFRGYTAFMGVYRAIDIALGVYI